MRVLFLFAATAAVLCQSAFANPHWNPQRVPKDASYASSSLRLADVRKLKTVTNEDAVSVLRVQVDWLEKSDGYDIAGMVIEPSGTPALLSRSTHKPKWGSYLGVLKNKDGSKIYYDAVGTGKEYRKLTRAMTFRFPVPAEEMTFELFAEHPQTGAMEKVFSKTVSAKKFPRLQAEIDGVEIKELAKAAKSPSVRVNFYADGYKESDKELFWQHALKAVRALQNENFPGVEYMSFYAVFHASNLELGKANKLGLPVQERDSFLGMYYPYWDNFGRWYNVVYPTREDKMRRGMAVAAYDYPIILINNNEYWGVGNYMAFTAIPAASSGYFNYLLMHEFGHFFGLNEEYQGGGRTELEFAPEINEPWSQNITFLTDKSYDKLKWNTFVKKTTSLPTPDSEWRSNPPVYGAYQGGYADSTSTKGKSHIPGLNCTMESAKHFCDICRQGVEDVVHYGVGESV